MALAQVLAARLLSLPPSINRAAIQDDASSIISEGTYLHAHARACSPLSDASMLSHARATDATTNSLGASSTSSSFDTRSCRSEPSTSVASSLPQGLSSLPAPRQNEHLAVLLPRRLWKVSPVRFLPFPPLPATHAPPAHPLSNRTRASLLPSRPRGWACPCLWIRCPHLSVSARD